MGAKAKRQSPAPRKGPLPTDQRSLLNAADWIGGASGLRTFLLGGDPARARARELKVLLEHLTFKRIDLEQVAGAIVWAAASAGAPPDKVRARELGEEREQDARAFNRLIVAIRDLLDIGTRLDEVVRLSVLRRHASAKGPVNGSAMEGEVATAVEHVRKLRRLLAPIDIPPRAAGESGRPHSWRTQADADLQALGVPERTRRRLLRLVAERFQLDAERDEIQAARSALAK